MIFGTFLAEFCTSRSVRSVVRENEVIEEKN